MSAKDIERLANALRDTLYGSSLENVDVTAEQAIRTVLAAQREPSDRMIDIGSDFTESRSAAKWAWQAMIDHILAE